MSKLIFPLTDTAFECSCDIDIMEGIAKHFKGYEFNIKFGPISFTSFDTTSINFEEFFDMVSIGKKTSNMGEHQNI